MKSFVVCALLCISSVLVPYPAAAQSIQPDQAVQYIDSNVTIEGQVSQVSQSGSGTIFINFGGTYVSVA